MFDDTVSLTEILLPGMRVVESDACHASSLGSSDAGCGIFHDCAVTWWYAQPFGCFQVDIRVWLAVRQFCTADDGIEVGPDAKAAQYHLDDIASR